MNPFHGDHWYLCIVFPKIKQQNDKKLEINTK